MFGMNPILKAFLKFEGIYFAFILNALFSPSTLHQKLKLFRIVRDPDKFTLGVMFDWASSAEGTPYWKEKSDKWMEFYFVMRTNGYIKPHDTDLY